MFELRGVTRHYAAQLGLFSPRSLTLRAVDGVDLSLVEGETLALVGESGCGKSTVARLLVRLEPPTAGTILYRGNLGRGPSLVASPGTEREGRDLWAMSRPEVRRFRREVQLVFQDPYSSLNPRMRVEEIVGEPLAIHRIARGEERRRKVLDLLEQVGLPPEAMVGYPQEFSGGQRQRIGIARALAVGPRVLVADEPVSALDVSIQAQILNLLLDLRATRGLTYVFISHDLRVVAHVSDRVAVMYLGRIVELAPVAELFFRPLHPYTRMLLGAVPQPDPAKAHESGVPRGEVPSPINPPRGCPFHPRCPEVFGPCSVESPRPVTPARDRSVACHLFR